MTTPSNNLPDQQIKIFPKEWNLSYVNLARISHSPADIVIEFAHILPSEETTANIRSRLVMSPLSAKLFCAHSLKTSHATKPPSARSNCPAIIRLQRIFSVRTPHLSHQKNKPLNE